jgi:cobaltochelatase CobT
LILHRGRQYYATYLSLLECRSRYSGYTTRAWKGGRSHAAWLKNGKPTNPGRLNDLRHIVYKGFSASIKDTRINFGLMVRDGLLKENIDGEALIWAYRRSVKFGKGRKLIVVVSDGVPVDDATLTETRGNFLEQHLLTTISWIQNESIVELYGIGIGRNVKRYYKNNISVKTSDAIGTKIFSALKKWTG